MIISIESIEKNKIVFSMKDVWSIKEHNMHITFTSSAKTFPVFFDSYKKEIPIVESPHDIHKSFRSFMTEEEMTFMVNEINNRIIEKIIS